MKTEEGLMKVWSKLTAILLTLSLLTVSAGALTVEQAKELLQIYYVDGVPERVLEQSTVEDVLKALGDPYTEYFDAEDYAAFLNSMKDDTAYGIGVTMQMTENGVLVADVLTGLGAGQAGIKKGDLITAVDGHSTVGVDMDTAQTWIGGAEGTKVDVTVLRAGTTRTYTITRAKIVIPATTSGLIDGHIGYLECTTFGPETLGHFEEGIQLYDAQASRWIVDLRSNGGGDVDASVQAAGVFAGSGEMAYLKDNQERYGVFTREEGGRSMDPVIVLTSGYTASAAEIFSFVIRDRQAGLVVGERTYGKGVAQILLDSTVEPSYFQDGSALKITTYRVFSANGVTDDKVGVIPHLLVDPYLAGEVALLLSDSNPRGDTTGKLRLDMGWRWYVDLPTAAEEGMRPVLTELLEAIPDSAGLWLGTGGADGWEQTSAAQVAQQYGLDEYVPRAFMDTKDSPYADQISALATYQIVAGSGDGAFRPNGTLTRGQLCTLLAQALRYETNQTGTFSDVDPKAYYAPSVEAMYAAGLVTGGSDGLFRPDDPVDHQQFITILARAAQRLSIRFSQALKTDHAQIMQDKVLASYAQWARESVWLLDGSQMNPLGMRVTLLWEELPNIAPNEATTREEAAAGLYKLLSYTGILPA